MKEFSDHFDAYCAARDEAKTGEARYLITFDKKVWIVADRKPLMRSRDTEVYEVTADGQTLHA